MAIKNPQDTITLANSVQMPGIGFGVWQIDQDKTADCVVEAIKCGYRNIDTAAAYFNEREVGEGIRRAIDEGIVTREELFVSTKLWNDHRGHDRALEAFETSMELLGLDYLDLYMPHWPAVAKWHEDWREINRDTWSALEELYAQGRVRAIGVANFLGHHVAALTEDADIAPMVDQIEVHPGFWNPETVAYCQAHDVAVQGWSPFGTGGVLASEELAAIAQRYGVTTAQLCLRWELQKGVTPLPKSVNPARMAANLDVFGFEISEADMAVIDALPYLGGMAFNPDKAKS